ncbi:MAG: CotH kinase family protein [Lachnospiraceae bacterium]|nr:CotH kinase family protein [Lachnospiraceae bacterium]
MMNGRHVLACLVVLCGTLALLLINTDNIYTELVFSRESGFYEEPFELELYSPPGTQIYYTLDGSEPNINSTRYTLPILINDATPNENVYSRCTDVSSEFLSRTITAYPPYITPSLNYSIDKCTVVRSAYRDADGNFSEIKTESYFIGYEEKVGYENINIISIVTDPDNLFDPDIGIYVMGSAFDESQPQTANYNQRGFAWERAATIQLFDSERTLLLNKDCGIRIHGGSSRINVPRSMNIYARKQYDGEGRFYVDLFDTEYMADTVTLFTGGNDAILKFRDMLVSRLIIDRNFATMNHVPYAMFLDGEYWGVYWLTEKYDNVYLSHYYDVDKDNIILIGSLDPEEYAENNHEFCTQMMEYMTYHDMSIDAHYQNACELIDMQSYIDYYATEIYIARHDDWPGGNEALWRVDKTGNGEYEDGRWRWMLYDVNSASLGADAISMDTFISTMDKSPIFYNLCQNEDFKRQFATTFMDLVNTSFTTENVDNIISEQIALMEEPTKTNLKRFFGDEGIKKYADEVLKIQNFYDNRKPYIVQYLKDDFDLTGTLASVDLEINDAASGHIILNTIEPSFNADGKWTGEYYTDYPITLTAVADAGYHFVQWQSDALSEDQRTNETIQLSIEEKGLSIKAIFEKTEN